jgi:hypothetical protein
MAGARLPVIIWGYEISGRRRQDLAVSGGAQAHRQIQSAACIAPFILIHETFFP